jgi:hypothetical protein
MPLDTYRKAKDVQPHLDMGRRTSDTYAGIRGEIFWTLRDVQTGEETHGHFKNVVTMDASILIARLMRSSASPHVSEPNFGVYALAVGAGDVGWNLQNPPPASKTQRSLYNEIGRKAIASSSFIDGNGSVSGIPTNVVDFTTVFSESEAVGPIVEMGLIGGDVSTNMSVRSPVLPPNGAYDPTVNLVGMDTLVNYLTFPVINKPPTSTLSWTWRLSF